MAYPIIIIRLMVNGTVTVLVTFSKSSGESLPSSVWLDERWELRELDIDSKAFSNFNKIGGEIHLTI